MLLSRAGCALALSALLGANLFAQDTGELPATTIEDAVVESAGGVAEGPGHGAIEVRLGLFDVGDDRDGNPFIDESLTVIEPIVLYEWAGSETTSYSAQFSYDNVTSASIERLSQFPDQSGASGDFYFGLDLGIYHKWSDVTDLAGRFGVSKEYDYTSVGAGGTWSKKSADGNTKLSTSLDVFFDQLDIIRFDGVTEGSDDRVSVTGSVNWYQTLSRKTHGELGLTIAQQSGFLETPYNAVLIEGPGDPAQPTLGGPAEIAGLNFVDEELPNDRMRTALHGRVRTLVAPDTALELGARLYNDDWGITGISLEPAWFQQIGASRLRVRYRYYDQGESDYFSSSFTTTPAFRTQDSDLGAFDSHTFGVNLQWPAGAHTTWDVGADTILRSDGLDQVVFTVGWRKTY